MAQGPHPRGAGAAERQVRSVRPWKPTVRKYRYQYTLAGGLVRLPPGERWFVERTWWRSQGARRFATWEEAMAYANHLPTITHF
jgi:hypothetical protein